MRFSVFLLLWRARVAAEGRSVGAVWWRVPDILENLVDVSRREQRMDLVVEPRINRWQGREDVQLEIKDVRVHEEAPLATA